MKNNHVAIILVILSTFFWGSNFNVGAIVVQQVAPLCAASERFIIATLVIFIYMLIRDKNNIVTFKLNWKPFLLLGLCGITGFNLAFFIGLQTTSPINGALIMATSPVTTALIAAIIDKNHITKSQGIGMFISLLGVTLVISNGNVANLLQLEFSSGDLIIMLGNLAWATYTVGCRKFIFNSTPLQTTTFTMLFGTLGIVLLTVFQADLIEQLTHISLANHLLLIYLAIAGAVIAYLFWNIGIKRLGAAKTSIFFNLVPVFAMLISSVTGQIPNILQLVGTILVISGVIYATRASRIVVKES